MPPRDADSPRSKGWSARRIATFIILNRHKLNLDDLFFDAITDHEQYPTRVDNRLAELASEAQALLHDLQPDSIGSLTTALRLEYEGLK